MRIGRWIWVLPIVLIVAVVGATLWAQLAPAPMAEAVSALVSDVHVQVEWAHGWWVFRPTADQPSVGLILYPGGRVDPRAYAPVARAVAGMGYRVIIVPMPLNLAVLAPERAGAVMAAYPEVKRWAVGGHSLGGAMAARYAYRHQDVVQGLVLWAAYPASTDDLASSSLAVVSIYGSDDGLASPSKIDASRPLLPATTRWVEIEGGNHAQFGWYGAQRGDNQATISREKQQQQVIDATAGLLRLLAPVDARLGWPQIGIETTGFCQKRVEIAPLAACSTIHLLIQSSRIDPVAWCI